MSVPVLEARAIRVVYHTPRGRAVAVDDVDLEVQSGEFLGIVGESGCGKSTLLFALTRLLQPPAELAAGAIMFRGSNLVSLTETALRALRWDGVSVVMQSAMNALNPVLTVARQFADAMRSHGVGSAREIRGRSREVLAMVGIDAIHLDSYPHQLSGGMRQRVMIAMALLLRPDLVVMDEPTSALDVVAQRSLMVQIRELQRRLGFAVVFVTHDMSLVAQFSDRLAVMYAGAIVEIGPTPAIFAAPQHPYTQALLDCFPSIHGPRRALQGLPGAPPSLLDPPAGCRFRPRCARAMPRCGAQVPPLYPIGAIQCRCFLHDAAVAEPA